MAFRVLKFFFRSEMCEMPDQQHADFQQYLNPVSLFLVITEHKIHFILGQGGTRVFKGLEKSRCQGLIVRGHAFPQVEFPGLGRHVPERWWRGSPLTRQYLLPP